MTDQDAIRIIAQHLAKSALDAYVTDALVDRWEDYPEVGWHDWGRVVAAADTMLAYPSDADYAAAYELLKGRADGSR